MKRDIHVYRCVWYYLLLSFRYTNHMATQSMSFHVNQGRACRYRYWLTSYLNLVIGQDLSLVKLRFRPVERGPDSLVKGEMEGAPAPIAKAKKLLYLLRGRLKHLRLETRHLS